MVVLTGASSGIGRATAFAFAARGARLVLAARDAEALSQVARECHDTMGALAVTAPVDVREESSVRAVADVALERFGRIDVWINAAGVSMFGPIEACPTRAVRELFETNVMGVLHGMRAALDVFRRQRSGVVINVGSIAGKVAYAESGPYCASKHAVHALTEAVRQELRGANIHACLVVPETVDTPLYAHAANYSGRQILAMRPIADADRVAKAIVRCALRPRRERKVGALPRLLPWLLAAVPWALDKLLRAVVLREHLGRAGAVADDGNLTMPREPHAIDGGWKSRRSPPTRIAAGVRTLALPVLTSGG